MNIKENIKASILFYNLKVTNNWLLKKFSYIWPYLSIVGKYFENKTIFEKLILEGKKST